MGCARTGSGKTAAFVLPILQQLSVDPYGVFALVLAPTRELAFQIAETFVLLGRAIGPAGLQVAVLVGGRDMLEQSAALANRPHIVVATPGTGTFHTISAYRICTSHPSLFRSAVLSTPLFTPFANATPCNRIVIFLRHFIPHPTHSLIFSIT